MTTELINELRRLRDASNVEEDRVILSAILQADEASHSESTDEYLRAACGHVTFITLMDGKGRCPVCALASSHKRARYLNGW